MRHTISVLVENKFGALTRIAGLFSGRGYNIDSLNVAPTHDPTASRMTIVTRGDDATLEQILKQLGGQFVLGQTMDLALKEARVLEAEGYTYSYDMLGEGAKTHADAQRYWQSYHDAIVNIGAHCVHDDIAHGGAGRHHRVLHAVAQSVPLADRHFGGDMNMYFHKVIGAAFADAALLDVGDARDTPGHLDHRFLDVVPNIAVKDLVHSPLQD